MNVVIDADTGTDDAIALIMAVNSPELQIDSVTTVAGNTRLAHTTRNTIRLLSYLGRPDILVSKGADRPLRVKNRFADHYHGPGGMTTRLPTTDRKPIPTRAAEHIIEAVNQAGGELDVIALGPLTNIARAIQRGPDTMSQIRRICVMGEAAEVPGNITPSAEFNQHCVRLWNRYYAGRAGCRRRSGIRSQRNGLANRHIDRREVGSPDHARLVRPNVAQGEAVLAPPDRLRHKPCQTF